MMQKKIITRRSYIRHITTLINVYYTYYVMYYYIDIYRYGGYNTLLNKKINQMNRFLIRK